MSKDDDMKNKSNKTQRRRLLTVLAGGSAAYVAIPSKWSAPIVNTIVLPAHAQTSAAMCMTDTTIGGPLLGNAAGATTCQAACEAEATSQSAQLCGVIETVDSMGATQCDCELDLP